MIPTDTLESMFWVAVTGVVWLGLAVLTVAILWLALRWAGRICAKREMRVVAVVSDTSMSGKINHVGADDMTRQDGF